MSAKTMIPTLSMIVLSILIVSQAGLVDRGQNNFTNNLAAPPTTSPFNYVVIIVMNNASNGGVIGNSAAPYLNSLANTYGFAASYTAVSPHKVPNNLALTGGQTFNVTTDCAPNSLQCQVPWRAPNIVDRIESAGLSWKAWAEDYPLLQGCTSVVKSPSGSGLYNAKSFPFVYYQDINGTAARCSNLLRANSVVSGSPETDDLFLGSLSSTSSAANFMWLTPNDCDAMHSCLPLNTVSTADTYLSRLVPRILNSTIFTTQKAALFITFSEGTAKISSTTDYVPTVWAGPVARTNFRSSNQYSHYSLLKTIETAWNMPSLAQNDSVAIPMTEFFTSISTPLATISHSPAAPVAGESVNFTATASDGKSPYFFTWNLGDGTSSVTGGTSNPNTLLHVYASAGTFKVELNATDSNGKIAMTSTTITVYSPLVVNVIGPTSTTAGTPVSFVAVSSGGTPPYSFAWNFGDGSPSGNGSPVTYTYTNPGNYTISVTTTDSAGATAMAAQIIAVAASVPCTVTGISISPITPETGSQATISASVSNCATPLSFAWNFGDGSSGVGNPVQHVYNSSGSFRLNVTATDAQTHTGSLSANITVASRISLTIAGPKPTDVGLANSLVAMTLGGVGTIACRWSFGDGITGAGCSATHTYSVAGTYNMSVVAVDSLNLTASASAIIIVNSAPALRLSPLSGLSTVPLNFSATTTGGVGPFAFSWNFGDGTSGFVTAVSNNATHTYTSPGAYRVSINATDSLGEIASALLAVDVSAPVANLTVVLSGPVSASVGTLVSFVATASGGKTPYSFSWILGDGTTSETIGVVSPNIVSHAFLSNGTYLITVAVTDPQGRTASARTSIIILAAHKDSPPVFSSFPSFELVNVGEPVSFRILATDPDDQTVYLFATGLPIGATFDASTGRFYWTPASGQNGTFLVTFTATDNEITAMPVSETTVITVKAVPSQPCRDCSTLLTAAQSGPYLYYAGLLSLVSSVALASLVVGVKYGRRPDTREPATPGLDLGWKTVSESEDEGKS